MVADGLEELPNVAPTLAETDRRAAVVDQWPVATAYIDQSPAHTAALGRNPL